MVQNTGDQRPWVSYTVRSCSGRLRAAVLDERKVCIRGLVVMEEFVLLAVRRRIGWLVWLIIGQVA